MSRLNQFINLTFALRGITVAVLMGPAIALSDSRLETGPLPTTLVDREDCMITEAFSQGGGWGWDGAKTCKVTSLRLFGAEHNLTGDQIANSIITWNVEALANQTLRCDSYQLRYDFSARTRAYKRSRYDITTLIGNSIPASALNETIDEVTAHVYTRGLETGRTGLLSGSNALVNLRAGAFATEQGYLFIEDRGQRLDDGPYIVNKFSHCWLRDQMQPLRVCTDINGSAIGWDGEKVCNIVPSTHCDYRDAGENNGWGYDPKLNQSCPPADGGS